MNDSGAMKLDSDDFELFDVPRRFQQEHAVLDARWRALQAEVHPDRFVAEGPAAQRVAMQWAVRVNEAHQRLKNPLKRAAYLCELAGEHINAESNTAMPPQFLVRQMAWREALAEARLPSEVHALQEEVEGQRAALMSELSRLLDERHDAAAAVGEVRALMFVERFAQDVDHRLEQLGQ